MQPFAKRSLGITLIELMVVVVIIAILAAIAYPSYRAQVLRSQRTEGRAALMQAAQQCERAFTRTNTYVGCVTLPFTSESGLYQISNGGTAATASTFVLRATPQGGQAQDTQCGWLQLDQANRRTSETSAAGCW